MVIKEEDLRSPGTDKDQNVASLPLSLEERRYLQADGPGLEDTGLVGLGAGTLLTKSGVALPRPACTLLLKARLKCWGMLA